MTLSEIQIFGLIAGTSVATFFISRHWLAWKMLVLNGLVLSVTLAFFYTVGMFALNSELPPSPARGAADGQVAWELVPDPVARWQTNIEEAASECGIHPALLAAIVMTESSGNPDAIGPVGERGLAQLMEVTAREMNVTNRSDPDQSLRGGGCYLAKMIARYDSVEMGLVGYNAGPGNADKGIIPKSTKEYGRVVMARFRDWTATSNAQTPLVAASVSSLVGCCVWPVVGGYVSQIPNTDDHMAYDMAVVIGTPITASHGGRVVKVARLTKGYGHHVVIAGENGISSLYAHLSHISVAHGDIVRQGQELGRSGNTGNSTGPHLHFEILKNGIRVDPYGAIGTPYE